MTDCKQAKVPATLMAPNPNGEMQTYHAVLQLCEAQCGHDQFWFGVGTVALDDGETLPLPPCNPGTGGFRVDLEDGRSGTAILRQMRGIQGYWEISFVGLSPLRSCFPTTTNN